MPSMRVAHREIAAANSGPPGRSTRAASPIAAIRSALLARWYSGPKGFAWLVQEIFADDYRGTTITVRGNFRAPGTTGRTGLFVRVMTAPVIHGPFTAEAALADPSNHIVMIANHADWSAHEITAPIPHQADTIAFGVFLAGPGRIDLRDPELIPAGPA